MNQFLKRCFYHSGQYSSEEHFLELDKILKEKEVLIDTWILSLDYAIIKVWIKCISIISIKNVDIESLGN